MQVPNRGARHEWVNCLITLAEAALLACLETGGTSDRTVPVEELNEMARLLSRFAPVLSFSTNQTTMKSLAAADLRGGHFADGGRIVTFHDGRPPLRELAMRRSAFRLAVELMKAGREFKSPG